MDALAARIKKYRAIRDLSQDKLAGLLGIPRTSLSMIENGERKVCAKELRMLSEIFDVSIDELMDEKKEPLVSIREEHSPYKEAEPELRIDVPQKNLAKFREVLLYLLNRVGAKPNIGETVIYKLLYFIDFDYYERYEEQLIGATYKKNRYGPTPLEFRKILEDMIRKNEVVKVLHKYYQYPQTKYLPCRNADLSKLGATEKEVIDHVLDRLADMNAAQISEYSHNDVPWLTTPESGIIPYESVFYRTPAYSVRKYDEGLS